MHQRTLVRLVHLILLFVLAACASLRAGDAKYLVDYKGAVSANVGAKGDAAYKLSPADLAAYRGNRQRLVNLLSAQPAAKPPIGVSLWLDVKAGSPVSSGEKDHPTWPVPTIRYVHFNGVIERDGKVVAALLAP
jgi:hypothetical protein